MELIIVAMLLSFNIRIWVHGEIVNVSHETGQKSIYESDKKEGKKYICETPFNLIDFVINL